MNSQTWFRWVGLRAGLVLFLLTALILVFYLLGGTEAGAGIAGGYAFLFLLPFCLGAIYRYALGPRDTPRSRWLTSGSSITLLVVFLVLALALREAIICILIAVVPWSISAFLGSYSIHWFHEQFKKRATLNSFALAALPFAVLGLGPLADNPTHHFEVRRSVTIDAPAEAVWPHLLSLQDLSDEEGVFNFAQDIVQIPRPRSAVVVGEGVGARRLARWGDHVSFEEHITAWEENDHLAWRFVFPNDSVARYTDLHIGPDSQYLGVETGSYTLERLDDNRSRLTLSTRYRASSAVNHYAAIWGEIFLGGIQRNILAIIADRVHLTRSQETAS